MKRDNILTALSQYNTSYNDEAVMVSDTIHFVAGHPECFERSLLVGHLTGSAWILNETHTHALLIHHVKIGKWFQPGGHCDGDPDVIAVAMKEGFEETGLPLTILSRGIFDVDIHAIPEKKDIPHHLHYDIRYVFTAPMSEMNLNANREISAGRWIPLDEVVSYNDSPSILRLVTKTAQRQF